MKKKKYFMAFAAILALVCGSLTRISAYANSDSMESRGNFILSSEELSIRASDMDNLQSAVQGLYDELPSVIGIKASAAGRIRRDDIQSKGIINYGNGAVVLDSADFYLLVDEVNDLESQYKANVAAALKGIRTYFKSDGSIVHEQEEDTLSPGDAARLPFDVICNGILRSQSVDHLAAAPAVENNISAGAAAWVNGKCIIGNGRDVQEAYDRGYDEGGEDGYDRGYDDGYEQGKSDGYTEGYEQGDQDGYDRGYNDGYGQGKSDGYTEGYEQGDRDGYERGYEQGDSDGYRRGYAEGKADAEPGEARIEYHYHEHEGVSTEAGGCYAESKSPCAGRMLATDTGTLVPEMGQDQGKGFYRYGRRCDVCGYTDTDISNGAPHIGQMTGTCPQYTTTIVINCGKTDKTIESVTVYYE